MDFDIGFDFWDVSDHDELRSRPHPSFPEDNTDFLSEDNSFDPHFDSVEYDDVISITEEEMNTSHDDLGMYFTFSHNFKAIVS